MSQKQPNKPAASKSKVKGKGAVIPAQEKPQSAVENIRGGYMGDYSGGNYSKGRATDGEDS